MIKYHTLFYKKWKASDQNLLHVAGIFIIQREPWLAGTLRRPRNLCQLGASGIFIDSEGVDPVELQTIFNGMVSTVLFRARLYPT